MKLKKFLRASLLLIITVFHFGLDVKESEIKAKSGNDIPRILESEERQHILMDFYMEMIKILYRVDRGSQVFILIMLNMN